MTSHDYEEILSPNLYFDRTLSCEAVKILPGEYYVSGRDMVMVTVLGSCVAACIRDKVTGVGGMNHFMLPDCKIGGDLLSPSGRYGVYAMEIMINQILKCGAQRENLEAKLFGGGNVLRGFTVTNIGQCNAAFALEYLETENIPVVAHDLLDDYPRKVYFFPASGKVLVRVLRRVNNDTIIERERSYGSRIKDADINGEVELF
ncbi:MAG: chemotaxis protein CheD [Gallionellales bacterium RIFOXYB12_FULL_54_9]|jgi:chemotaxis protein CheD|nr:MAG: chemotaxis protein CheD [Gallionellales bacterium RIFOXYB12_FULL_54_9]